MSSADDPASNGALFTVFLVLWGFISLGIAGLVVLGLLWKALRGKEE